jgi:hypothetical protein
MQLIWHINCDGVGYAGSMTDFHDAEMLVSPRHSRMAAAPKAGSLLLIA